MTAWDFHMAAGFRHLGHHCDVVTFTKSGRPPKSGQPRPGWQWWINEADVTARISDAADVLSSYDLIVLNEPKCGSVDNRAQKDGVKPYYIDALAQTRTPWLTVLHDTRYNDAIAPFVQECLTAGQFTGIAVQHQFQSYEMNADRLPGLKLVQPWPWLPYERAPQPGSPVDKRKIFGMVGRVTSNKGQATLMSVADELPPGWEVHICGNEPGGRGACITYLCWESLTRARGWQGFREGNGQRPANDEANVGGTPPPPGVFNYGDKLKCWPWFLQKGENTIRFRGAYENGVEICREFAVMVNLTAPSFSRTLEYSTLEAIDAGCEIVAPQFCLDVTPGPYQFFSLDEWGETAVTTRPANSDDFRTARFDGVVHDELVKELHTAAWAVENGLGSNAANQELLYTQHHPSLLAGEMLRLIGR